MIFLFFDIAHHNRNEIKYTTSTALRKLKPINKPRSPPVLAKIKINFYQLLNLLLMYQFMYQQ